LKRCLDFHVLFLRWTSASTVAALGVGYGEV
jgi:hypothetical protein